MLSENMVVRITSFHRELQVTTASTILIGKISSGLTRLYILKLDGENNCLNSAGVFARSHAAPATSMDNDNCVSVGN